MKRSLETFSPFSQMQAYFEPLQIELKENHSKIKVVGTKVISLTSKKFIV